MYISHESNAKIYSCRWEYFEDVPSECGYIEGWSASYSIDFDFCGEMEYLLNLVSTVKENHKAIDSSRMEKEAKIISEIKYYSSLEDNWDFYGGVAPSVVTIKDAISFIFALPSDIDLPKHSVSGRGKIGLYWKGEEYSASALFIGNGRVSFYANCKGEEVFGDEEVFDVNNIPSSLLKVLQIAR